MTSAHRHPTSIAKSPSISAPTTAREFERISGVSMAKIQQSPVEYAKKYARSTGVILLLKGPTTIVTDGDSVILTNTGCAGMATAGSGDVLSGILCAMCGAHSNILEAVSIGAFVNGYAGQMAQAEYGDISMVASDTARFIAKAIKELTKD